MKKRIFCFFLSLALLTAMIPLTYTAAETVESHIPAAMLEYLMDKFPAGAYWNHADGGANNPDGVSSTPCTHHDSGACTAYNGQCGCNYFDYSIQCHGFAMKLANECYGGSARNWKEVNTIDGIKAGCVVRMRSTYNMHTIFITDVTDSTITYADCNFDHQCGIRWNAKISRSDLASRVQYMLISPGQMLPTRPRIGCRSTFYQYDNISAIWEPIEGISAYTVTIKYGGKKLLSKTVQTTSYVFEAQAAGTYTLTVTAENSAGASSATVSIEVLAHDCDSKRFWDVANYSDWSHEGVDYAIRNGLFNGTSDTTFSPNENMTRGMIATVLCRNAAPDLIAQYNPYYDVEDNAWYTQGILWAYETGVMSGVGGGSFAPKSPLTREQIVTVLYRYAQCLGITPTGTASITDYADGTKVSEWARTAMGWAIANGIMQGSADNGKLYLRPQDGATRAQTATILMRFLEKYIHPAV